ncbi:MAG: hypothetical protein H3C62_02040 [Gemmatimonadaceae bacterium]|nr:hypothetical protein [Gemmatimonadaceae bacterium]
MRTALAFGALLVSMPALAQPGRSSGDRGRDRGADARGRRQDPRADERGGRRDDGRNKERDRARVERRDGDVGRVDPRGSGRVEPPRVRLPDNARGRYDRRPDQRIAVRPPVVIDRYDRHGVRVVPPPVRYAPPVRYRYGDRDYRHRDVLTITAWFRALPPARLATYHYYGPAYRGIYYSFRPGLYLSLTVYDQLSLLPYELELQLGELPWYLERRIYGNTVLVIDTRTRQIVDIYELDY